MERAWLRRIGALAALGASISAALSLSIGSALSAGWGAPVNVETIPGTSPEFNSSSLDGCPFESPDGLSFYMASDRPGGQGGIDIWKSTRNSVNAGWGTPVNLGAPVNSGADDFCPTPVEDGRLFFVSGRPGGCGGPDLYVAKPSGDGWDEPENLGCEANGPGAEFSPSLLDMGSAGTVLFYSSARAGGFAPEADGAAPDQDIYFSPVLPDGSFGEATLVDGVNTAVDDVRPNVRLDGLEMVFDSVRPGGLGGPDVWISSRASIGAAWSSPVNPGAPINSPQGESRASLSRNGERLYFGSGRPGGDGGADIYVATLGGASPASPTPTPATSAPANPAPTTAAPAPANAGTGPALDPGQDPAPLMVLVGAGAAVLGLIGLRRLTGRASR